MIGIGATLFKVPTAYGAAAFSPKSLFSNGEEGAWYDPSDLSSMFQNSDGTGAAAVDSPVGYIADKSGNGNHATQATSTKRPTLRLSGGLYYLEFDGTDDALQTSAIDFTGGDTMSVFAGARKEADEVSVVAELSANIGSNNGAFRLATISGNIWRYSTKGTSVSNANATDYTPPVTSVLTGQSDISDNLNIIRVDGVQKASAGAPQGSGNYGNHVLNVGARNGATLALEGRIYGLIVRGASSSAAEIANAEAYMANKTGVSI